MGIIGTHEKVAIAIPIATCTLLIRIPFHICVPNGNPVGFDQRG